MNGAQHIRHAAAAAIAMLLMSLAAWALTPSRMLTEVRGKPDFEVLVPGQFGDWREEKATFAQIINPQQEQMLSRIYTQILSRTYVNSQGQRIMLSLAYGEDQRDGMQLHYPEVCYPAQGFMVQSQQRDVLVADGRNISVKRLSTQLGTSRRESVTYWTLLGDQIFSGGLNKKLAEMRYGLRGLVADGLLFRISSIEQDPRDGYALQETFSRELLAALSSEAKVRLVGEH